MRVREYMSSTNTPNSCAAKAWWVEPRGLGSASTPGSTSKGMRPSPSRATPPTRLHRTCICTPAETGRATLLPLAIGMTTGFAAPRGGEFHSAVSRICSYRPSPSSRRLRCFLDSLQPRPSSALSSPRSSDVELAVVKSAMNLRRGAQQRFTAGACGCCSPPAPAPTPPSLNWRSSTKPPAAKPLRSPRPTPLPRTRISPRRG